MGPGAFERRGPRHATLRVAVAQLFRNLFERHRPVAAYRIRGRVIRLDRALVAGTCDVGLCLGCLTFFLLGLLGRTESALDELAALCVLALNALRVDAQKNLDAVPRPLGDKRRLDASVQCVLSFRTCRPGWG